MNFCIGLIVLVLLVKTTLQDCATVDLKVDYTSRYGKALGFKSFIIHCENESLSSNFYKKLPPVDETCKVLLLEISNSDSPTIESGAFGTLNVPNVTIEGAGVSLINEGAFHGLKGVKMLSLRNNKIIEVKKYSFGDLPDLQMLDLSYNSIERISEGSFTMLRSLNYLLLQNNELRELPLQSFKDLTNLEHLDLSFNVLTHIVNGTFETLTSLRILFLNNNLLAEFDNSLLSKNLRLEVIDVSNNLLRKAVNLSFADRLTTLNFSSTLLQELSFSKRTSIHNLDLSSNGLESLTNYSFNHLAVVELFLDNNFLTLGKLHNEFHNLTSVETISLSHNLLPELDPNLFKMNRRLSKLILSQNYLTSLVLPGTLKHLDLRSNIFNSQLNLTGLVNLLWLDISHNYLTDLPYNFLQDLKSLFQLNIGNNKIKNVSLGCFRNLKALRVLDLSCNKISSLEPGVFVGLDNLLNLDLSNNSLTKIHVGVFHSVRYLQVLNLAQNKVTYESVSYALGYFTDFREIGLAGNDWSCESLSKIVKPYEKMRIIDVAEYDKVNVGGTACINTPQQEDMPIAQIVELKTVAIRKVTTKLYNNNVLLSLILFAFGCKFVVNYFLPLVIDRVRIMFLRRANQADDAANPGLEFEMN